MNSGDWLTVRELAAATKFHPSTIVRLIADGKLEAYRIGQRSYRVARSAWEANLDRRRRSPRTQSGTPSRRRGKIGGGV